MKIKVNYALIEKINESKNGIRLHKITKEEFMIFGGILVALTPLYAISFVKSTIISILSAAVSNASFVAVDYLIEKKI